MTCSYWIPGIVIICVMVPLTLSIGVGIVWKNYNDEQDFNKKCLDAGGTLVEKKFVTRCYNIDECSMAKCSTKNMKP